MFSGLKEAFMSGTDKGKKWYRNRVASAAHTAHTITKYKEHGHQFVHGVKKEIARTGHEIKKAEITGRRDAITYHTEKRLKEFNKKHPQRNITLLKLGANNVHKREQEIRDKQKAELKTRAEEKIRHAKEIQLKKERIAKRMAEMKTKMKLQTKTKVRKVSKKIGKKIKIRKPKQSGVPKVVYMFGQPGNAVQPEPPKVKRKVKSKSIKTKRKMGMFSF